MNHYLQAENSDFAIRVSFINEDSIAKFEIVESQVPVEYARFLNNAVIDVRELNHFYVDAEGKKYCSKIIDSYQSVDCLFDDELIQDKGIWRVVTREDVYRNNLKVVDKLREEEYTMRVRPFLEEAEIKKHMGDLAEYERLMDLAVEERAKIQAENPWPVAPEA